MNGRQQFCRVGSRALTGIWIWHAVKVGMVAGTAERQDLPVWIFHVRKN
jgi:hypothetical protein